jgi:hypothetical protein
MTHTFVSSKIHEINQKIANKSLKSIKKKAGTVQLILSYPSKSMKNNKIYMK